MGYVNKLYRGLSAPEWQPGELQDSTEKLWIAAAETYAIGGACQLLHVMDHVIAERGCRLYLPARKEGIIPGASNMRLARAVGDRIARQAILSGREFEAGAPDGDLLCDEVVEPGEMDAAIERRIELLTSSGLVNAAANRRMMRVAAEPLDVFRTYMALYAREQAFCHFSPALDRQPRAPLGCTQPPSLTSSARRASTCARCSSSACARSSRACSTPSRSRASACTPPACARREDVRSLDDLRRLPFSMKSDLREHYPFGLLAVPREELVRVHASSGTGGKADRRRLHPARPRHLDRRDGALPGHGRRARPGCSCTTPTATGSSPAASASTRAPSGWARRSCRCRAASPTARSRCCATCAPRSSSPPRPTRCTSATRWPSTASGPTTSRSRSASSEASRGPRPWARRSRARSAWRP